MPTAIEEAIVAAEHALGVRITVRDDDRLLGDDLPAARRSHKGIDACRLGFSPACIAHCRHAVGARATSASGPFVHRCWKGLREVVAPLMSDGAVRGLLFAGPWRDRPPADAPAGVLAAAARLPAYDAAKAEGLGRVLAVLAAGLVQLAQARRDPRAPRQREDEIRRFVAERAGTPVRIADLARALGLSPSRAAHVVHAAFGRRFDALVRDERIARAKAMLLASDEPAGVIAARVGFSDEFRFNRVFRAATGMPPGRFRRQGGERAT